MGDDKVKVRGGGVRKGTLDAEGSVGDADVERAILELLAARAPGKSI